MKKFFSVILSVAIILYSANFANALYSYYSNDG